MEGENEYTTEADGTIVYRWPMPLLSTYYKKDPNSPRRFPLNVEPCLDRRILLRTLKCGKKRGDIFCRQFGRVVSPKDCQTCTTRREGNSES